MNAKELRDDLIRHLSSIDKKSLNMYDLRVYCDMVESTLRMSKPDMSDSIMAMMHSCACPKKEED